ncbi:MAG: histidine--tRNA ligase [Lutibacter sp.]|jgi:histidyl-tRNA synthetase
METRVTKIRPTLPGGFRDYLPEDMIPRQKMFDIIRSVFEIFGFEPLDTSVVERLETMTGGDPAFRMNLFRTGIVQGVEEKATENLDEMALRFDLTVPLARVLAANPDLPKPFKRYQLGYVFRGEKPQAGRFRGFTQFDADIVGSSSILADTEIINLMYETMNALGVENFIIKFNSRKILNGLASFVGFDTPDDKKKEVFRIIDKLDKIGWKEVANELTRQQENTLDTTAPAINERGLEIIKQFVGLKDEEAIAVLKKWFVNTPVGMEGVNELEEIVTNLKILGIPKENWVVDLSVARGLGYYTGPVFETSLKDLPGIGAVFSGGRYDDLVNRFSDANLPATGASVGVDRLFVALEMLGKLKKQKSICNVLIINFDPNLKADYLELARNLRMTGISTQIYFGEEKSFKAQLAYALNLEIPIILIEGEDEKKTGVVLVKDTINRTQKAIKKENIAEYVKTLLKKT